MRKLDRLGWAAGVTYATYGLRVGIRTTGELGHDVTEHLPEGARRVSIRAVDRLYSIIDGGAASGARRGVRRYHLLYADARLCARTLERADLHAALESDLEKFVAASSRQKLFVHAGVVGYRGRAVVLPGKSHAGKSTLVAALLRAGASYYSDEYAVFDAEGRVRPFRSWLSMRAGEERFRVTPAPEDRLPLEVGLVANVTYHPGASFAPRSLTPGRALLTLLANTVAARTRPKSALSILHTAVAHAHAIESPRGEADLMAERLLELVSS